MPLNVITLEKNQTDHIIQMVSIAESTINMKYMLNEVRFWIF
jgi:hypothetical protein